MSNYLNGDTFEKTFKLICEAITVNRINNDGNIEDDEVPIPESKKREIIKQIAKAYGASNLQNYAYNLKGGPNEFDGRSMKRRRAMFDFLSNKERDDYINRMLNARDELRGESDKFFDDNGFKLERVNYLNRHGRMPDPGISAVISRDKNKYNIDYEPDKK